MFFFCSPLLTLPLLVPTSCDDDDDALIVAFAVTERGERIDVDIPKGTR